MNRESKPEHANSSPSGTQNLTRLLAVMARLRDPETGCPWDVEQDFATIAPYTIEEAYEVADAIARGDMEGLKDELGDLLLQTVFHARMAEEKGLFAFEDVAGAIADKLVRRHPHVFADADRDSFSKESWEASKESERSEKADENGESGALDGVALALPALTRAEKLQKRAARVGFDWPEPVQVLDKIEEEIGELRAEMAAGAALAGVRDEIGDLLFAVVNLARRFGIDPEAALRQGNEKFTRRFNYIEESLAKENRLPTDAGLDEMETLWGQAKAAEKAVGD